MALSSTATSSMRYLRTELLSPRYPRADVYSQIKDKEASAKAVVTGTRKRAAVPIGDVLANRIIIGGSVCLFVLVSLIVFTSLRRRRLKFAVNLQDANAVRPGRVAPVLAPQPDALATTGPHWHARQMPPPPPAYDEAVKV